MEATLIAHTDVTVDGFTSDIVFSLDPVVEKLGMEVDPEETSADALAEFAGRACYQSFHKPNPLTAENKDYLANILALGHESVLEHASATFYITGVSRSLTHELVRHRHLSFSELSQRYVNPTGVGIVRPPAVDVAEDPRVRVKLDVIALDAGQAYTAIRATLDSEGLPRKESREAARAVLPNATETRIVVTGNMRAWRDVLKKRYSVHADAEIRELATELLRQLRGIAPHTFADFPETPFE